MTAYETMSRFTIAESQTKKPCSGIKLCYIPLEGQQHIINRSTTKEVHDIDESISQR